MHTPRFRLLVGLAGLSLLIGAAPTSAKERRAHVRTAKVDDECDVRLGRSFRAVAYDRRKHKRLKRARFALEPGVVIKLVSSVSRRIKRRLVSYYIYRWKHGGTSRYFVLDAKLRVPTRYDGVWRKFALLPSPPKGSRRDPPRLVTRLRIVR